ncbi:MAG: hypothetical protein PVF45_02135 [Anaerolineae bacterium]|jgi:hypothetical protein
MHEHFWMDITRSATGVILPIRGTIKVFKAKRIGGLFAVLVRKGRPSMANSGLTSTEAFVAGFNLNLEMLGLPRLTPDQSKVLRKTLDEAMAEHQKQAPAELLGWAMEQILGLQRDSSPIEAVKAFVGLVNEKMEEAEGVTRLTEDQSDALGGMIYALKG